MRALARPIHLKDRTFGAPAAERDADLSEYFIESNIYRAFEAGQATILIGNRGSGKSAIFKMLAERQAKNGRIVIQISPDEYSYEILSSVLRKELDGSWAKQGSYTASWKYVLYVTVMRELVRSNVAPKSRSFKQIRGFLRDNVKGDQYSILDHIISYMRRFEGIKLGQYEMRGAAKELKQLYDLDEINRLFDPLRMLLNAKKVSVFIDELDRGWDASEDARQFVAGLFQAAIQANGLSPNLKIFVSLRRELYDNIPEIYEDAQKVRDLVRYIGWDENGLKKLMAKRIESVFRLQNDDVDELWSAVFQETLEYRKTRSFNYIVDRTLYRPREIIHFCNACLREATEDDELIGYDVIARAEYEYSRDRFQDIASEYRFGYPGLDEVFETFRGRVYNLTREELELHCLEVIVGERRCPGAEDWLAELEDWQLIGVLWEVGFLRGLAVGGQKAVARSGSRYVGSHQVSSLNLEQVQQYHIHPMFRSYLALKEK